MWRRWLYIVPFLPACMPPRLEQQRLPDGSWQMTCRAPMDECIRELENTCRSKRYRILGATSELKLRDAPPYEKEYRTSKLSFICSSDNEVPPAPAANSLPEAGDGRTCGAGDTRACVGPGGCAGGQTCRPDGVGFGTCDCGLAGVGLKAPQPSTNAVTPPLDAGVSDAQNR
jgi:hypothetical protein